MTCPAYGKEPMPGLDPTPMYACAARAGGGAAKVGCEACTYDGAYADGYACAYAGAYA